MPAEAGGVVGEIAQRIIVYSLALLGGTQGSQERRQLSARSGQQGILSLHSLTSLWLAILRGDRSMHIAWKPRAISASRSRRLSFGQR